VVAGFVVLAGLLGMLTAILTALNERRREMAILRSVGAQPRHILVLMLSECGLLAAGGVAVGVLLTYAGLLLARPALQDRLGLFIPIEPPSVLAVAMLGGVILCAFLVGLVPAVRAYRTTLSDGLQIRI
jgi:putative ABC transport system permease protein